MPDYLYRKYIDLVREASCKFVNWDPLYDVKVGSYGSLDSETGLLKVEGNIYDPEFERELELDNVKVKLTDYLPQEGPIEEDLIITTRGAKQKDWDKDKEADVPGLADATIKGKWAFERPDKREAILILHKPRQYSMPPNVILEPLFNVDALVEKTLVTGVYTCPAYSMYLSERSPDATDNTVSIALLSSGATETTAEGNESKTWWVDSEKGVFRTGSEETGKYAFKTLSIMRHPIKRIRRHFRDKIRPEPTGDEFWFFEHCPWEPLDEEGVEDPLDPEVYRVDPFADVFAEAIRRNDPRLPRSMRMNPPPPPPPESDD